MHRHQEQRCRSPQRGDKFQRKKLLGNSGASNREAALWPQREEAEGKNKFNMNIKMLTDDVLDKFASIRIRSKRGRAPLPNVKQPQLPRNDWSGVSSENENSNQLPEKEVILLFERMMEDMNLNEDRKAPLREKDIDTKREMVVQYIGASSNTSGLKNKQYSATLPHEFIHELRMAAGDERLLASLESLRVSLTSNTVRLSGSLTDF